MLISEELETIEIPHEPGAWVKVRELTGAELRKAKLVRVREIAELMNGITIDAKDASATEVDPSAEYDFVTLIKFAVREWSAPVPCNSDNKAKLDAATEDFLAREIVRRNVRTPGEVNGSGIV